MYKSSSAFMKRLPASRFWRECAGVFPLSPVNDVELQVAALADAIVARQGLRVTMDLFSDHELCRLLVTVHNKGLLDGPVAIQLADRIARMLDKDCEDVSLSETERVFVSSAVNSAAIRWRKH